MSSLDQSAITDGIDGLIQGGKGLLGVAAASAVGGAIIGGLVAGTIAKRSSSRKKKNHKARRKITHTSRGWKHDRKRRSKQKWEVAYQERKRKSKKGIHYTKNGQPYKILASGKARFIKRRK